MTRDFEDKRRCPHCGGELHRVRYLMERSAEVNVLSSRAIAWVSWPFWSSSSSASASPVRPSAGAPD
jgi:hypothetical protein